MERDYVAVVSKGTRQLALEMSRGPGWQLGNLPNNSAYHFVDSPLEYNRWTQVTGVRNGESQHLYIDGILVDSTITFIGAVGDNRRENENVWFANKPNQPTNFFNGSVDEIRMYTIAPAPEYIRLCYESQKPGQTLVEPLQPVRVIPIIQSNPRPSLQSMLNWEITQQMKMWSISGRLLSNQQKQQFTVSIIEFYNKQ